MQDLCRPFWGIRICLLIGSRLPGDDLESEPSSSRWHEQKSHDVFGISPLPTQLILEGSFEAMRASI